MNNLLRIEFQTNQVSNHEMKLFYSNFVPQIKLLFNLRLIFLKSFGY